MATTYVKCPHIQANPDGFEAHPRDDSKQKIWDTRISNKKVFLGCHACIRARIEEEWSKTELGRQTLTHMRKVSLVTVEGGTMYAPEGLIEAGEHTWVNPRGETVISRGFRISETYKLPETICETISEPDVVEPTPVEEIPETIPDTIELRTFLEPVVAANEKFVALWKQGKTGPLIGAAMRAAAGKYEGKYIEQTLKEIVGALKSDVGKDS